MSRDHKSWESKVHPAFPAGAEAFKDVISRLKSLGQEASEEQKQGFSVNSNNESQEFGTDIPS